MIGRRGRAGIWKLLLPFPLAALMSIAVYVGARRAWRVAPATSPTGEVQSQERSEAVAEPARSTDAPAAPAEEAPSPDAASGPSLEMGPGQQPAEPSPRESERPPSARAPRAEAPTISPSTEEKESFGPAAETAAPSNEAALRASEPPPAVASAPNLTPALSVPMVPAPEPQEAPRAARPQVVSPLRDSWARESIRAVRFDAGYYYGRGSSARQLAQGLAQSWSEQGVNLVYFYAYNRVYGARYRTRYAGNVMEDYGRQDLLGHLLREAHGRGIKVIAWLNGVQHKQMWDARPDWRQKTRDGGDYKPDGDSHFLCVRNPEVMQWWLGLVDDLLTHYPELDGIDLAEFQIDLWGDNACYCEHCRGQFEDIHPGAPMPGGEWRKFRADGLTRVLLASSRLAHSYGKEAHITTIFTARPDGSLMSSAQVRDAIGFDLDAVLRGPDGPDVMQAELIWQQWDALYGGGVFTSEWTRQAIRQAKRMVGGRARLMAHLEVTDFGSGGLDGQSLARTISAAVQERPYGIDIYDSYQLEKTEEATRHLQMAWLGFAD